MNEIKTPSQKKKEKRQRRGGKGKSRKPTPKRLFFLGTVLLTVIHQRLVWREA